MDLLTLDPEIDAQIMSKLQGGVELPIPYQDLHIEHPGHRRKGL